MTCLFLLSLIFSSSSYAGNCTFFVSLSQLSKKSSKSPAADQFGINRNSDVHSIENSSSKQNRVQCPKCSGEFSKKSSLDRHIRDGICEKIKNPNAPFKCKICLRGYDSKGSLNRHLGKEKICGSKKKPQIPCGLCGNFFTQKCSLVRHLKGACQGVKSTSAIYPDDKNDNQEILTTSNTEH